MKVQRALAVNLSDHFSGIVFRDPERLTPSKDPPAAIKLVRKIQMLRQYVLTDLSSTF